MKMVLVLALFGPAVDDVRIDARADVIGGAPDADTTAVVAVELHGHVVCSGSLVSARAVLTAAHCSWFPGLVVRISSRVLEVVDVARPAGATPGSFEHDLAVLELEAPVHDVAPLSIGMLSESDQSLRLVGFGRDEDGDEGERRSVMASIAEVGEDTVRLDGAYATACRGDSGGPALRGGSSETIVAVVSHGDPACESFAVLQRVEAHAEWLDETLARIDEGSDAEGCRAGGGRGPRGGGLAFALLALASRGRRRAPRRVLFHRHDRRDIVPPRRQHPAAS